MEKSVYLFIADATGRSGASEEAIAIAEMVGSSLRNELSNLF